MLPRRHGKVVGAAPLARSHRPHGPEKRVWRDQDLQSQSPSRWPSRMWRYGCDHPTAFNAGRSGRPHHHLGIRQFTVMGFCIGGPFIWNLLNRAGDRVVAAVPVQPSGYRHEMPDLSYTNNMKGWGPELCERRPDITMAQVDAFLTNMYRGDRADFVYTVSRDFVRQCQTPVLVLPDDVLGHPYVVAMESVYLAPNAQVTLYPWKANPTQIQIALRHVRGSLRENRPAAAARPLAAASK